MLSSAPPAIKATQSIISSVTSAVTRSCFTSQKPPKAATAKKKQRVKSQRMARSTPPPANTGAAATREALIAR